MHKVQALDPAQWTFKGTSPMPNSEPLCTIASSPFLAYCLFSLLRARASQKAPVGLKRRTPSTPSIHAGTEPPFFEGQLSSGKGRRRPCSFSCSKRYCKRAKDTKPEAEKTIEQGNDCIHSVLLVRWSYAGARSRVFPSLVRNCAPAVRPREMGLSLLWRHVVVGGT